ncbi:hypothetical protein O3P69_019914 [Scylla paramamosain]|uniref:Uncharacterized protein n=1 Tax=Scylla paramamosain TaxID=85552 RepID=A0AAW0SEC2_SCYPA
MPSHNIMKNYLRLEKKYEDRVKAIYHDLSTPALLARCMKGHTQNRNEGLHSKLWLHQNKAKFAGLNRVRFMSQLTILNHNLGYESTHFIAHIGFPSTAERIKTMEKMDKSRKSPRQQQKKRTTRRKESASADYQPGGFDL